MHHIFPFRLQRDKHLLSIQTPKQSEGGFLVFKIDFLTIVRIFNFFQLGKPSKKKVWKFSTLGGGVKPN